MDKRKTDDDNSPGRPWLSYLLIALLVLVAVWIVLALMGPYIGHVYSNTGSLSRSFRRLAMEKRKVDERPKYRWVPYALVALLVLVLIVLLIELVAPEMGVFSSVIEAMTQTIDARATQTAAP